MVEPASGVIQAGVVCYGDDATARALLRVSGGVETPEYRRQGRRKTPPGECVACARPMVSWTRDRVPEGWVMHHARGFCSQCREPYREFLRSRPSGPRALRKRVDRSRHHAVSAERGRRELAVQLRLW